MQQDSLKQKLNSLAFDFIQRDTIVNSLGQLPAVKHDDLSLFGSITIDSKVLVTAVIAGFIGAILAAVISHVRNRITLRIKKRMLIADLYVKKIFLGDLKATYVELLERFNRLEVRRWNMIHFHNLNLDIFNSVDKHDLYRIFGSRMPQVVGIYHLIDHLRSNDSGALYADYVSKVNRYHDEIDEVVDDVRRSPRIMTWIELVKVSCESRIRTIDGLLNEIEYYVKHIRKNPNSSR